MGKLAEEAARYAISAHSRINQLRKDSGQPYDVHLQAVAKMVSAVTEDEVTIAAAWLHDTVEDTPATFEDIEREFGPEVMALVKELTDISRPGDGNRAARKEIDRRHLAGASPRAKTVKLADLIDNCTDICRNDPNFGLVFLGEMESLLKVLPEGDSSLFAKAAETAAACAAMLGKSTSPAEEDDELHEFDEWLPKEILPGQRGIRLFAGAFAARDLQEPLLSLDAESIEGAGFTADAFPNVPVFGVRRKGTVTDYLAREDVSPGAAARIRRIDPQQVLSLESSLTDVIHVLTDYTFCFVSIDGSVIGVIRRDDIEKPVVRMWLFGIIILIEIFMVQIIRSRWPGDSWTSEVSERRLEKARELQAERKRRGLEADLVDCLQFSDKQQLFFREPKFVRGSGFATAAAAKTAATDLETLRNNLAHGQDISKHDWAPIVRLARRVEQIYGA